MRNTTWVAALVAALLCAGGLAACGGDDDDSGGSAAAPSTTAGESGGTSTAGQIDPTKPKVHLSLISAKVPAADLLTPFKAGADAAANAINAKGGIGGREIVVDSCNSQFQPPVVVTCARKLIANDPIVQFGCELSWGAAGLPIYSKAGIGSMNCTNTPQDYSSPLGWGVTPSDTGQQGAQANWLCTKADVKNVVLIKPDLPQLKDGAKLTKSILEGCGKTLSEAVYFPLDVVDPTPYVQKALKADPDFIMFSFSNAGVVSFFKALNQAGWPANKVVSPDTDFIYEEILKPAGSIMDGAYAIGQYGFWGDKSNPEIQQYLKDTENSPVDPRDSTVQWGYYDVMLVYTAAQKIGFDKFNAKTFADWMNSANGTDLVLSRKLTVPGPTGFEQSRQPYAQIAQYHASDSSFTIEQGGDDNWFYGFGPQSEAGS